MLCMDAFASCVRCTLTHRNLQLLLSSQLGDFELQFELLTSGVGRLTGVLEEVRGFAIDGVEVLHFLHWFSSASLATPIISSNNKN